MFSFSLRMYFFCIFFVCSVSSCTRAAVVVATPQPTAIQLQNRNNNSSTYIYTVRVLRPCRPETRQASTRERASQVLLPRASHVRVFYVCYFPHSFFVVPSSFIIRKANRQQQIIWIFPSTGDTQPCDGPPSKLYHF